MFVPEAAQASRDCFLHISDLSAAGKATLSAADFFAPVSVKNNDAEILAEIIGRNNRAEVICTDRRETRGVFRNNAKLCFFAKNPSCTAFGGA